MATEAQIIANRPNAQKSTGPRSPRLATNDQRLTTNYAKQTQFAGCSNERKFSLNKAL